MFFCSSEISAVCWVKYFLQEHVWAHLTQQSLYVPPLERTHSHTDHRLGLVFPGCSSSRADAFLPRVSNGYFNGQRMKALIVKATSGLKENIFKRSAECRRQEVNTVMPSALGRSFNAHREIFCNVHP